MSYYSPIAGWRCWSISCRRHESPQGESDKLDRAMFHRQYWADGTSWPWYKGRARVWSWTYWTFTLSGWIQLGRLFVSNFQSFKLVWWAEFLIAYARQYAIIIQISLSQRTPGPHSCTKMEYTMWTIPATVCLRARFWLRFANYLLLWYINLCTLRPSSPSSHLLVRYPRRKFKVDVRRDRELPTVARELTWPHWSEWSLSHPVQSLTLLFRYSFHPLLGYYIGTDPSIQASFCLIELRNLADHWWGIWLRCLL